MSPLLDRTKRAGPHLEWKVRLFAAGAVLGVSGMYLEEAWLTGAGILVLAAGVLLRFVRDGTGDPERGGGGEEDGSGGADEGQGYGRR